MDERKAVEREGLDFSNGFCYIALLVVEEQFEHEFFLGPGVFFQEAFQFVSFSVGQAEVGVGGLHAVGRFQPQVGAFDAVEGFRHGLFEL